MNEKDIAALLSGGIPILLLILAGLFGGVFITAFNYYIVGLIIIAGIAMQVLYILESPLRMALIYSAFYGIYWLLTIPGTA